MDRRMIGIVFVVVGLAVAIALNAKRISSALTEATNSPQEETDPRFDTPAIRIVEKPTVSAPKIKVSKDMAESASAESRPVHPKRMRKAKSNRKPAAISPARPLKPTTEAKQQFLPKNPLHQRWLQPTPHDQVVHRRAKVEPECRPDRSCNDQVSLLGVVVETSGTELAHPKVVTGRWKTGKRYDRRPLLYIK